MCGIVGVVAKSLNGFSCDQRDAFIDGLFMDALRGTDGTGVMYGRNNGEVVVMKEASPSWKFLAQPEPKTMANEIYQNGRWAFGHNRAATRGSKIDANAHPFIVNNKIVLLQNGTYNGSHHHHKNTDVDTEAIAHVIAEHPENLEEALQKIDAAYVLVWWNNDEKSLNIIRNDLRPLYWAEDKDNGSLYFFSEWGMAYAACARHDILFKQIPKEVTAGVHVKISYPKGLSSDWTVEKTKLDITYKAPARFFPREAPSSAPSRHGGQGPWTSTTVTDATIKRARTGNNLPVYDVGEAYDGLKVIDFNFESIGGFAHNYFYSNKATERIKLTSELRKEENRQLLVDWAGYERPTNNAASDWWYLYGTVDAGINDPLDNLPVVTIVRGDEEDVKEYVNKYQGLYTLHKVPLERADTAKNMVGNEEYRYFMFYVDPVATIMDWTYTQATQTTLENPSGTTH